VTAVQWFIVPNLEGPISGGTHYNRMLIAALKSAHVPCHVLPLDMAPPVLARADIKDSIWIDSLYLDDFPWLAHWAKPSAQVGMIGHYLPSLISKGEGISPKDLTPKETAALRIAGMFLVPSPFMREIVHRLTGGNRPILEVEPGRIARAALSLPAPPVRALMVANLVPGKGVAAFLRGLAEKIRRSDTLHLNIIGGSAQAPAHAERCRALVGHPCLRGHVHFLGELSPDETLGRISASNLLVSASHMESYGMALAEARTVGLPIVARQGGHVAAMVGRESGGELVATTTDLASACLKLCRDPVEHRARMERARGLVLPGRPWSVAASEFCAQLAELDKTAAQGQAPRFAGEAAHDGG
jgi:glycosyltransferase involved in cell wall biosynthesis